MTLPPASRPLRALHTEPFPSTLLRINRMNRPHASTRRNLVMLVSRLRPSSDGLRFDGLRTGAAASWLLDA
jgi:hypothetical protein